MGRRGLGAQIPPLPLGKLCESGEGDKELSSCAVNVKGRRRENRYKLSSYLVPGSVLEPLFNLTPVLGTRTVLLKEVTTCSGPHSW